MWPFREDNSRVYGWCNINPRKILLKSTTQKRRESTWKTMQSHLYKNTIWPEIPFKTHRFTPTREKEIEVLLEIPLRQYAVTATAPGLHLPVETTTEDRRWNFGLGQISNNLKEVEKEVKHYSKVQEEIQEIQEGERCHTMYTSFSCGVSTTVMHSAMQSWYCFDWSLSRCRHDAWRHCRRLCGYFLCFGCNQQETED